MASMSEDVSESDIESLSAIFKEGLDSFDTIINGDQPTNSSEVQLCVKRTRKVFEKATRLVSLAGVFSQNEGLEEVATNDLQYFLLPALLGSLTLKLTSGERKEIVDVAEIYFKDFLNRCNEYGLSNYQFREHDSNTGTELELERTQFEQLEMAVNTRASKIQRFKQQKELKTRIETLRQNIENEHVDDEIKRDYFITTIKLHIHEAIDELNSIDVEKPILEHMANMKKDDKLQPKRQPPPPLKPIIITKDAMQKAVYGAGYPSLPTMTVNEFYEKRVADGIFPDPNKPKTGPLSLQEATLAGVSLNDDEQEAKAKDKLVEEDDEENIARMRAKDEFKDDHRRGWGNRMNRS